MFVRELRVEGLRCFERARMVPSGALNVLAGPNGSGKTTLLEAIYVAGSGRSFRGRCARDLVKRGVDRYRVYAVVEAEGGQRTSIGVERCANGGRIRVGGEEVRAASQLARLLPILLITPDSRRLLTDGSRLRRRMLDWALFHVEPAYNGLLWRYRRALRQRNSLLRRQPTAEDLEPWDRELAVAGEGLHAFRESYAEQVKGVIDELIGTLLGMPAVVSYKPGWDTSQSLFELLGRNFQQDLKRGFSGVGAHRADIQFRLHGTAVQDVLSGGECKLFIAAVLLAQTIYVRQRSQAVPVVLIDDLPSELDRGNRDKLQSVLARMRAQIFITSVSSDPLAMPGDIPPKLFHVEQGSVQEMI